MDYIVRSEYRNPGDDALSKINDIVKNPRGRVCNALIVSIIHDSNGNHGVDVMGPLLDNPNAALRALIYAQDMVRQHFSERN